MHSAVTKLSETVKGSQVHPQTSVLAFIRLPVVNARKQNRPTRTAKEIEKIITRPGIGISCLAYRVPISRFSWHCWRHATSSVGFKQGSAYRRGGQANMLIGTSVVKEPMIPVPNESFHKHDVRNLTHFFPFLLRPEYGVVCTRQDFRWVRLVE